MIHVYIAEHGLDFFLCAGVIMYAGIVEFVGIGCCRHDIVNHLDNVLSSFLGFCFVHFKRRKHLIYTVADIRYACVCFCEVFLHIAAGIHIHHIECVFGIIRSIGLNYEPEEGIYSVLLIQSAHDGYKVFYILT